MNQEDTEKSMPRRHWLLAGVGASAGLAGALYAWQKFQPQGVMDEAVQNFWLQEFEKPEGGTLSFQSMRGKPLLVNFWATWCGPCKMVAPVLEEIAKEKAGTLTVAKVDVDSNPSAARDFQVVSIPTLILFKDGKPVKRIVGAKGKAALLRELADVL